MQEVTTTARLNENGRLYLPKKSREMLGILGETVDVQVTVSLPARTEQ